MRRIAVCAVAALGAGAVVVTAAPAVAAPAPHPVRTITTGLDGPFGLQVTSARSLLVAENVSGEITRVSTRTGSKRVLVRNLPAPAGGRLRPGGPVVGVGGPDGGGGA